jgi:hypothetical protein
MPGAQNESEMVSEMLLDSRTLEDSMVVTGILKATQGKQIGKQLEGQKPKKP